MISTPASSAAQEQPLTLSQQLKGYTSPSSHLSNTTSLFHLTKNVPQGLPGDRLELPLVHMSTCNIYNYTAVKAHLRLHSFPDSASTLHVDNHGTLRKGEHAFDLGVWDNYHWSIRTKEREQEGSWWVASSFPEQTQRELLPSSKTNGRKNVNAWHMGISEVAWRHVGRVIKVCMYAQLRKAHLISLSGLLLFVRIHIGRATLIMCYVNWTVVCYNIPH